MIHGWFDLLGSTLRGRSSQSSEPAHIEADDHAPPAITCTRTASGGSVDLVKPDPADIRIEDIAAALAKLCRFSGRTKEHFSVAQHSIIVSLYVRRNSGYMGCSTMPWNASQQIGQRWGRREFPSRDLW